MEDTSVVFSFAFLQDSRSDGYISVVKHQSRINKQVKRYLIETHSYCSSSICLRRSFSASFGLPKSYMVLDLLRSMLPGLT